MTSEAALPRGRNATATRAALLEAARARFASIGYDGVGLRDLANDAGVDAALVCRYFGSKEELFAEVLASVAGRDWLEGGAEDLGRRLAHMLVYEQRKEENLDCLLILLRSIGSAKAHETIRGWCRANFHGPFEAALGGDGAPARARLLAAILMGVAVSRVMSPDFDLDDAGRADLYERLSDIFQRCVEA